MSRTGRRNDGSQTTAEGDIMALNEEGYVASAAARHEVSEETVWTVLKALRSGGGRMAQFSHRDFGGMCQWSPGMTMVGDMFNDRLKSKLDGLCTELAGHLADMPSAATATSDNEISYRSSPTKKDMDWWPARLGAPSSVGSQNDLRYAVFPTTRRLAIQDGDHIDVYDTGDHRIFGVAQAQSADQTLTFTSQDGLVRVADLPKVST
jgi:hypothetical protein